MLQEKWWPNLLKYEPSCNKPGVPFKSGLNYTLHKKKKTGRINLRVTRPQLDTLMLSVWGLLRAEPCHCSGLHWTGPAGAGCPPSSCWPRSEAPAGPRTLRRASCSPEGRHEAESAAATAITQEVLLARHRALPSWSFRTWRTKKAAETRGTSFFKRLGSPAALKNNCDGFWLSGFAPR